MKTPDIPQECGLIMFDGVCATIASGRGVLLNLNEPQGRAALAAYCMAVIDVMIAECWGEERKIPHGGLTFWFQQVRGLHAWRAEWSRYGNFQK